MNPWEPVLIAREAGKLYVRKINKKSHSVGKKTEGLLRIPKCWTLPFFALSDQLFQEWTKEIEGERNKLVHDWLSPLDTPDFPIHLFKERKVIVRSSGLQEGMSSRGRFYSQEGFFTDLQQLVSSCLQHLAAEESHQKLDIALVVQEYIEPRAKGHLSNERRCYAERRDWLGETERLGTKSGDQFKINVRHWRESETAENTEPDTEIQCRIQTNISKSLRPVADWFYSYTDKRYHLEWVWDGNAIAIVQADEGDGSTGIDPTKIKESTLPIDLQNRLSVIQPLNESHKVLYSKIRNVSIYQKLGLTTVPIFVLDDHTILKSIALDNFPENLKNDIELLVKSPLVIRTDLNEKNHAKKQLLRRSDELRDFASAKAWLIEAAAELLSLEVESEKRAFIFHNFVPAISSAFVLAEPTNRIVQIEGLWGLPEGLYYNSHDQFMVDTLFPNLEQAEAAPLRNFKITKKPNFKNFFVSPDENGRWTRQIVAPPYDWRSSIQKNSWIKKIALDSRRIASVEGRPLSIMWFIGVAGKHGWTETMPWFHEPFDPNSIIRQPVHKRTKTSLDISFHIASNQDLAKLEDLAKTESRDRLRRISVSPTEDSLLRDKEILQRIGSLAHKIDATIVLEGAVLSHAYYQLASTGAIVEVVHPFIGFDETREFNKLVRDEIPAMIQNHGESVVVGKLEQEALLKALKAKLVEEAYEVNDSGNYDLILDELADVQQIIISILKCLGADQEEVEAKRATKEKERGSFERGLVLLRTSKGVPTSTDVEGSLSLEGIDPGANSALAINEQQFVELSEKIDKWLDARRSKTWQESLVTLQIPVSRQNWDAVCRPIKIENTDFQAVGNISTKRKGDKFHVEVKVRLERPEPDLFSPPERETA